MSELGASCMTTNNAAARCSNEIMATNLFLRTKIRCQSFKLEIEHRAYMSKTSGRSRFNRCFDVEFPDHHEHE